jgi:hypothetical protein
VTAVEFIEIRKSAMRRRRRARCRTSPTDPVLNDRGHRSLAL